MHAISHSTDKVTPGSDWQSRFLEQLPHFEQQLSQSFQHLRGEERDEAMSEGLAACAVSFERLDRQGRTGNVPPQAIARYVVKQIRSGRQIATRLNVADPLSRYAQIRKRFFVERLDRRC